jgi:hypothetical protein
MVAQLSAIAVAALVLNGVDRAGKHMLWLNGCWGLAVVLLAARTRLRRASHLIGAAELLVNVCGMLLLAHLSLETPEAYLMTDIALALAFATALSGAIVRLGLLLDGRRTVIRLTDA